MTASPTISSLVVMAVFRVSVSSVSVMVPVLGMPPFCPTRSFCELS